MAVFPGAVATDVHLYLVSNNLGTVLTAGIDAVVTTIPVVSTTGFPTTGWITIDQEAIQYTGITGTSFTGCTRGAGGTVAASHLIGAGVKQTVVAAHHNALKDEIKAIEQFVSDHIGLTTVVTAAEFERLNGVTSPIQTQLNAKAPLASPTFTGTVTIPSPFTLGATSVTASGAEMNFLVGVTSAIQTQLNAKATDSLVVHLAGTETITGAKTFSGVLTEFSRPGSLAVQITDADAIRRDGSNSSGPSRSYRKYRNTFASPAIVASGDELGYIGFQGYDGSQLIEAAAIIAKVDGTPGTNDMPGRIGFHTVADGSNVLTEAMRVNNSHQLDMLAHKIIGLAAATANGEALRFEQMQVVQYVIATTSTDFSTTSSTYQTSNLSASITPTSTANKILVFAMAECSRTGTNAAKYSIFRGSTNVATDFISRWNTTVSQSQKCGLTLIAHDSPASVSSLTYSVKVLSEDNASSVSWGIDLGTQFMIIMEVKG